MLSQFQINFIKQVQQRPDFAHFLAHDMEDVDAYAAWHAEETAERSPIIVTYYTTAHVLRAHRVGVKRVLHTCEAA